MLRPQRGSRYRFCTSTCHSNIDIRQSCGQAQRPARTTLGEKQFRPDASGLAPLYFASAMLCSARPSVDVIIPAASGAEGVNVAPNAMGFGNTVQQVPLGHGYGPSVQPCTQLDRQLYGLMPSLSMPGAMLQLQGRRHAQIGENAKLNHKATHVWLIFSSSVKRDIKSSTRASMGSDQSQKG